MKPVKLVRAMALLAWARGAFWLVAASAAQAPAPQAQSQTLPSETPARSERVTGSFNYDRLDVMIPMRDGIRLHTVILVPRGARGAPMLLTRTPYDATALTTRAQSADLGPVLAGSDSTTDVIIEGGYIRVVQDARGKYGSEGGYQLMVSADISRGRCRESLETP